MAAPVPIPPLFLERMALLLGDDYPDFVAALERPPVGGLRVNTLKISTQEFIKRSPFPLGEAVPWCESAFILAGEEKPGKHAWHLVGLYYLQDPSAMAPAALLDPQPGERVVDLTAAPGGKTTQLAALMQGQGLLVANEIKGKRLGHLVMNMERWGARNVVIVNENPERLADTLGAFFDRVLVDAPCSGEGMFRKDPGARLDWSPEMVAGCALRQRNILRVAAHLVRPGGSLLYSTCTFAPEEDEGVIAEFLREHSDFRIRALPQLPGVLPGKPEWLAGRGREQGIDASLHGAARLFPHRLAGEGHFICLLERQEAGERSAIQVHVNGERMDQPDRTNMALWQSFAQDLLSDAMTPDRLRVRGDRLYLIPESMPDLRALRVVHPGLWLGTFKTRRFEPAHPLALFLNMQGARNVMNLASDDPCLAAYLRGETLPSPGAPGWVLLCVDGFGLGWGKRVQGVLKNHYPRGWI